MQHVVVAPGKTFYIAVHWYPNLGKYRVITFGEYKDGKFVFPTFFQLKSGYKKRIALLKNKLGDFFNYEIKGNEIIVDPFVKINELYDFSEVDDLKEGDLFLIDYLVEEEPKFNNVFSIYPEEKRVWKDLPAELVDTDKDRDKLKVYTYNTQTMNFIPPLTILDPLEKMLYIHVKEDNIVSDYFGRVTDRLFNVLSIWPELKFQVHGKFTRGEKTVIGGFEGIIRIDPDVVGELEPGLYFFYRVLENSITYGKIGEAYVIEQ